MLLFLPGLKDEEIRNGGMTLRVFEAREFRTVDPVTVRLAWFELHFQHTGFPIRFILWFANSFRGGVRPCGRPTPRLISHFLAEGYFDLCDAGRHVRGACLWDRLNYDGSHGCDRGCLRARNHSARQNSQPDWSGQFGCHRNSFHQGRTAAAFLSTARFLLTAIVPLPHLTIVPREKQTGRDCEGTV